MARLENQPATFSARPRATVKRSYSLSRFAIDRPKTTVALWALLSIAGVFAFLNLKLALLPDIAFPVVIVTARSAEIDVERNERTVTDPVEDALRGLPGISRLHSLTYPQYAVVDLSFDVSTSLAERRSQIEERLARLRLPAGVHTSISTVDLNETPVVTFALVAPGRSRADLARLADRRIGPVLRSTEGVLRADIVGAQATGKNASAYEVDGEPAVAIAVVKKANANTLDIGEATVERMDAIARNYPGVRILRTSEQATYIKEATRATQEALGIAVLLAIVVIWPFLRDLRATLISAIAIPVSLLGTACVMWLCRFNLETITLLALALVVGVIVDDAIVAVENIVRHIEAGETPKEAALRANREIGLTLVAATLTIVAVFLPIGLMRGTLGQFFRGFGITASAAVLFSLLAARTLSPAIAASWLRPHTGAPKAPAGGGVDRSSAHPRYRRVLHWALGHRPTVVALAILAFAGGLGLIPFIPKGFIPHLDRGEFRVTFSTPLGTSLGDTISVAQTLGTSVRGDPAVSNVYTTIGGGASNQQNVAVMDVYLRRERRVKTIDVENAVRAKLPAIDGVVATVSDVPFVGSQTAKPLQFALIGSDLDSLRTVGRDVQHRLEHVRGFVDVTASGLSDGTPFSAIEHVGGKRAVQITADLASTLQIGDANDRVTALARKVVPKGISLSFGGNSEDVVTTFRDFGIALALSVVAIVVVLLLLFRSWVDPLVIVVSLPLSIVGALFALWITRADFGMISLMAVIFLFGLVNKNAILLVDRIEKLRRVGLERPEAIEEAGAQRLRPIVMTTSATILGMLPIALGFGAGAELRAPMAVAIIGGLVTSTALSLIVIPVAYTIFDDWAHRGRPRAA